MNKAIRNSLCVTLCAIVTEAVCGPLDKAWLKGETDKAFLSYVPGETITLRLSPSGVKDEVPVGAYILKWKRTDDFGTVEEGWEPFDGKTPFVYKTKLDHPGFFRLTASVVDKSGKGLVSFDGGAGVQPEKLEAHPEPKDFDDFWARQYVRLDRVPVRADRVEVPSPDPNVKVYAVRIDCAGLRPVTGYLSVPTAVANGTQFVARLETHGYGGPSLPKPPSAVRDHEIVLNINAHGTKLAEFGATDVDARALAFDIRSHDCEYGFDPLQNEIAELAYFNGMVLRVKRALQYLKTVEGWNGKNLLASGSSQGGLQTIWAAACGEGVTRAESCVTWCCDIYTSGLSRRDEKLNLSTCGWYVPWTESMGYYDAVNFAKRIPKTCHTSITRAGMGDYCCPPMGLAKLWNAIPGNKEINWVQGSTHCNVPPYYPGRDLVLKETGYDIKYE